jgi:hypothetical protein
MPASKMSISQFLSIQENNNLKMVEYYRMMLPQLLNGTDDNGGFHHGDCTKSAVTCRLCLLEEFLRDYKTYYFAKDESS